HARPHQRSRFYRHRADAEESARSRSRVSRFALLRSVRPRRRGLLPRVYPELALPRHWLQRRRHPRKKRTEDFPRRRSNPASRTTTGKRERARVVRDQYYTIRCYAPTRFALSISDVLLAEDRRLALQALRLLMRDTLLSEAR